MSHDDPNAETDQWITHATPHASGINLVCLVERDPKTPVDAQAPAPEPRTASPGIPEAPGVSAAPSGPGIDPASLPAGTVVEVKYDEEGHQLAYVAEDGGYRYFRAFGRPRNRPAFGRRNWPSAWTITRVFTEARPEPRRIRPKDVRVGQLVEARKGEAAARGRVNLVTGEWIHASPMGAIWWPEAHQIGWSLWLVEDAPEPVDPDAELVEAIRGASYTISVNGVRMDPLPGLFEARQLLNALREAGYAVTREAGR